jgi:hypothetical protein
MGNKGKYGDVEVKAFYCPECGDKMNAESTPQGILCKCTCGRRYLASIVIGYEEV